MKEHCKYISMMANSDLNIQFEPISYGCRSWRFCSQKGTR